MSLKIVYEDIAVGAKADSTPSASSMSYASVADLKNDNNTVKNYALCLPRYSKLNGNFDNVPDTSEWTGWVSDQISGSDSAFAARPTLTISFGLSYSSVGVSFLFNELTDDFPEEIEITWYAGTTQLKNSTKTADSSRFFFSESVSGFDKLVICFDDTNNPYRPVFLTKLDFGLLRQFGVADLENPSCIMEVSQISEVLSINTLDFTVQGDSGISYMFQSKQSLYAYWGDTLLGKYYLDTGYRSGASKYKIQASDAVSVLDGLKWYGGMLNAATVSSTVADIMDGTGIAYELDGTLGSMTLAGYMPISTRREALAHVGLVIGAIIDTSFSDKLKIYPVPTTKTVDVDIDDCYTEPTINYSNTITGFDVTCHTYKDGTTAQELYNDTLDGTVMVQFSDPVHGLAISGGTIVESNCNYAKITGTGATVTLTGYKYQDIKTVLSYRNANATGAENVPEVDEATLINTANGNDVLTRLRTYYEQNKTAKATIVMTGFRPGAKTAIDCGYETVTGIAQKADLRFGRSIIKAEVEVR